MDSHREPTPDTDDTDKRYTPVHLKPWTLPRDYGGARWDGWYVAPVGQHRDSDTLDRSNWAAQWEALERYADGPEVESDDGPTAPVRIVQGRHWAVGWVEWVAIHSSARNALILADHLANRLENYPVLDEDAWTALQFEEACEYWERMSVRERIEAIHLSRSDVSIFAARRSEVPQDDNGALQDYLSRS